MFRPLRVAAFAVSVLAAGSAAALDLTVTHFGTGMYGVPFAVAREKGWFKSDAKLDVTGFITSAAAAPRSATRWPRTFRTAKWRCRPRSPPSSRGSS